MTPAGRGCFVILGEEKVETVWGDPMYPGEAEGREGSCDLRKGGGGLASLKSWGGVLVTAEDAGGPVT